MSKGFAWIGRSIVLGALLAGSCGVDGAIAAPFPVKKMLDHLQHPRTGVHPTTIPVLLPDDTPEGFENPPLSVLIFPESYHVPLDNNSNITTRLSASKVAKIDKNKDTKNIELVGGIRGFYSTYGGSMGTAKSSVFSWRYDGITYAIEQKRSSFPTSGGRMRKINLQHAVHIANSAIRGGIRNPKNGQNPVIANELSESKPEPGNGNSVSSDLSKPSVVQENAIASLPDGDYWYKGTVSRDEIIRFRKTGKMISAWQGSLTELTACLVGEVKGNSITRGFEYVQGYGKRSNFEYLKKPVDLSSFTPLTLQDAETSNNVTGNHIRKQLQYKVLRGCETKIDVLNDRFVAAYGSQLVTDSQVDAPKSDDTKNSSQAVATVQDAIVPPPAKNITSRPLTQQDLALLDRTIQDDRSKVKITDRSKIRNSVNNFLKPFAGGWIAADNQKYYVYPSTKKDRQACILVENGSSQELQIGVANGNNSGTDINVGNSRMFKTQDSNSLALRSPNSEALIPLYSSIKNAEITPSNLETMQQNSCMTSFPGVPADGGSIATKPIEKANKKSHSEIYASVIPGIQVENAICGSKTVNLFWEGPGLCSDKRQRSRILFEDGTAERQSNGSTKIKAKFFNVGYADATIEVYSRDGNLVDLKILDGYQPPTGFTESTVDVLKTPYDIFTSPYKIDDPRYGKPSKVEELTLPKGGYIKITKSSQIAQLYGIVGTLLDLFQAGGDLKSSYNPPSKVISKEVLVNFAKDSATKYTFSIYKSDPVLKAVSGHYDDLDLSKASTVLEDFRTYALKFEEDRQALKSDNQISNVFRDIGLSNFNEGIETGSDILLPGLGKAIKNVRSGGQFLNVLMKSAELSVAKKAGDENTIFIRDTSN